jgi:hypothetical protein
MHCAVKKGQTEAEINAALRQLTGDLRQLRAELASSSRRRTVRGMANDVPRPPRRSVTQPFEEDRKLRPMAKGKREP